MTNVRSLTTWQQRKALGDSHEETVRERLEQRGWTVARSGTGTFPDAIAWALSRTDSPLRSWPDLIAARDLEVCLIDCKTSMSPHTKRHSISRRAQEAHLDLLTRGKLPIYYVFSNLGVLTPYEVANLGPFAMAKGGAGAYYLVEDRHAHPFDAVFGDQWAWAEQLKLVA